MDRSGVLIILLGLFVIVITKSVQHGNTDSLVYLGTANGSSFYADIQAPVSWGVANWACNEEGMHLAGINTAEQVALLRENNVTEGNELRFWIAGRNIQPLSLFVWDHNGQTPDGSILNYTDRSLAPSYCLAFYRGLVGGYACQYLYNFICEQVVGS